MNIEEKVKMNLLTRGFDNKTQLNNRGLIGATIDETILEVVKNLRIADVSCQRQVIAANGLQLAECKNGYRYTPNFSRHFLPFLFWKGAVICQAGLLSRKLAMKNGIFNTFFEGRVLII